MFCQIVRGDIPAHVVWEDANYLAFLDIYPIRDGQLLVIPKKHMDSYVFSLPEAEVAGLFLASRAVCSLMTERLPCTRVAQVIEGLGVNHAHVKLYPVATDETEGGLVATGPRASEELLTELTKTIRGEG